MTALETVIRDAVEKGGYDYHSEMPPFHAELCEILLDPAFWRALGKARGWHIDPRELVIGSLNGKQPIEPALKKAGALLQHLFSGGDIESFFKSLDTNV